MADGDNKVPGQTIFLFLSSLIITSQRSHARLCRWNTTVRWQLPRPFIFNVRRRSIRHYVYVYLGVYEMDDGRGSGGGGGQGGATI